MTEQLTELEEWQRYRFAYEKNTEILIYLDKKYKTDTGKESGLLWECPGASGLMEWWKEHD